MRRPSHSTLVAYLALFVALGGTAWALGKDTVGSRQIKANAVKTADIADNAVTSPKVANGSLRGEDFEAGGLFIDALQGGAYTGTPPNDNRGCTVEDEWRECAPATVDVPPGKTYKVMIDSAGSFFAYNSTSQVQICTAARLSTTAFDPTDPECVNTPTGIDLSSELKAVATNGVRTLEGGPTGTSWIVSTAARTSDDLHFYNGFDTTVVHTMVTVAEVP